MPLILICVIHPVVCVVAVVQTNNNRDNQKRILLEQFPTKTSHFTIALHLKITWYSPAQLYGDNRAGHKITHNLFPGLGQTHKHTPSQVNVFAYYS